LKSTKTDIVFDYSDYSVSCKTLIFNNLLLQRHCKAWFQLCNVGRLCRLSEDTLLLLGCFIERLSEPDNKASKTNNNNRAKTQRHLEIFP